MKEEEEVKKPKKSTTEIKPKLDFIIKMNQFYYELKKGKKIEVNNIFLENLKTEKVI